mmetsp:Transcript_27824/g.83462  ORF Transcript_27824/g.83462 Transcript_27824/m.83462 type:complete len:148 (-) Transcript_27824:25-468(-)
MVAGWVRRKVKNSDKWVRRWLEVNRHVLYSYQACPTDTPSARVMNMLDLRKTRSIKLVDGGEDGCFVIIPESVDDSHPGYLMRADGKHPSELKVLAADWVAGLNKARNEEIEKTSANGGGRKREAGGCCSMCFGRKSAEREPLTRAY